jgi:signal transduction histidine kinase
MPEIDATIDGWMKRIVLENDLDRMVISQMDPTSGELTVRHAWSRGGLANVPIGLNLGNISQSFFHVLKDGHPLIFSKVSELPAQFVRDLKNIRRYFVKSDVTIPLRVDDEMIGTIGFATLRRERTWAPRVVRRLTLVAEIFASAVQRKHAVEENDLLRGELAHLSRAAVMGELTASLTHQLNQPMAAILSNAEAIQNLLESTQPDLGELHAAINDIVQDDLQAAEIIKGLRAFFRKDRLRKNQLELRELVSEVLRMVRSDALFKHVSLRFDKPSSPICVFADRIQLQQAVINLILNAFDAVSEVEGDRHVQIGILKEEDRVRLTISDSGKGLDPATISRIFHPFFTTKAGGMGMGLSIARSIVKGHGGKLSAYPNPDRGATFEISLPALKDAAT